MSDSPVARRTAAPSTTAGVDLIHDSTEASAADDARSEATGLWEGDTGTLRPVSRQVLVKLLHGPFLSAERHARLWATLLADESSIRSRLADLYLDLIIDYDAEVAFARNVDSEDAPTVLRTTPLTFIDTAMLLHLRQQLMQDSNSRRTFVDLDEVTEQLLIYKGQDSADPAGFAKRIEASWNKMKSYGLLNATSTPGRFEISPVLRLVFGPQEVAAVRDEYRRLAAPGTFEADTGSEKAHGGAPGASDAGVTK